ncbi:hypothetical protein HAX54_042590, partial [Datura stramonium]|nr:hypothetical protein [Datura stramonium]
SENSELHFQEATCVGTGDMLVLTCGRRFGMSGGTSGCKASSHCLDPHFTYASWAKIGEIPMWHRIDNFHPVFCQALAAQRQLAGLHPRFASLAPVPLALDFDPANY